MLKALKFACLGLCAAVALDCALAVSASAAGSAALTDFQQRCSAAGVLVCQGFDDPSVFVYTPGQTQGLFPIYGTTTIRGFQDTAVDVSGNSSLRFDIEDNTGPDDAGNFTVDFGQTFSQNSTFYVQYAVRFDSNYINTDWNAVANSSPKLAILYSGSSTCDQIELTTVEWYGSPIPTMYTDCGARGLTTSTTSITSYQNEQQPPFLLQQGTSTTDGYNCPYSSQGVFPTGTGNGSGCFHYPANTWMTLYYKVSVGTWGSPNSSIQAWVILNGVKKQWIDVTNFTLYPDNTANPGAGFDHLMITPYMTGKSTSAVYPTAHMWIDELIVSSQPIAAPGVQVLPSTPSNVAVH